MAVFSILLVIEFVVVWVTVQIIWARVVDGYILPTPTNFINDEKMEWSEAELHCLSTYNSHLASIHDAHSYITIRNKIISISRDNENYWIGLTYSSDSTYIWSDGTIFDFGINLNGKFPWFDGRPLSPENDRYVRLWGGNASLYWDDTDDDNEYFWICNDSPNNTPNIDINNLNNSSLSEINETKTEREIEKEREREIEIERDNNNSSEIDIFWRYLMIAILIISICILLLRVRTTWRNCQQRRLNQSLSKQVTDASILDSMDVAGTPYQENRNYNIRNIRNLYNNHHHHNKNNNNNYNHNNNKNKNKNKNKELVQFTSITSEEYDKSKSTQIIPFSPTLELPQFLVRSKSSTNNHSSDQQIQGIQGIQVPTLTHFNPIPSIPSPMKIDDVEIALQNAENSIYDDEHDGSITTDDIFGNQCNDCNDYNDCNDCNVSMIAMYDINTMARNSMVIKTDHELDELDELDDINDMNDSDAMSESDQSIIHKMTINKTRSGTMSNCAVIDPQSFCNTLDEYKFNEFTAGSDYVDLFLNIKGINDDDDDNNNNNNNDTDLMHDVEDMLDDIESTENDEDEEEEDTLSLDCDHNANGITKGIRNDEFIINGETSDDDTETKGNITEKDDNSENSIIIKSKSSKIINTKKRESELSDKEQEIKSNISEIMINLKRLRNMGYNKNT